MKNIIEELKANGGIYELDIINGYKELDKVIRIGSNINFDNIKSAIISIEDKKSDALSFKFVDYELNNIYSNVTITLKNIILPMKLISILGYNRLDLLVDDFKHLVCMLKGFSKKENIKLILDFNKNMIYLRSGNFKSGAVKISELNLNSTDFTIKSKEDPDNLIMDVKTNINDLISGLKHVGATIANSDTYNPDVKIMDFRMAENEIELVSTDGFRAHYSNIPVSGIVTDYNKEEALYLTKKKVGSLIKILGILKPTGKAGKDFNIKMLYDSEYRYITFILDDGIIKSVINLTSDKENNVEFFEIDELVKKTKYFGNEEIEKEDLTTINELLKKSKDEVIKLKIDKDLLTISNRKNLKENYNSFEYTKDFKQALELKESQTFGLNIKNLNEAIKEIKQPIFSFSEDIYNAKRIVDGEGINTAYLLPIRLDN